MRGEQVGDEPAYYLAAQVGDTVSDVGVLGLVEQLGEPDPGARQAAADALAAVGADAVASLVAALRGGQAPVAGLSARVLMRIGDPVLGPVAETLAATADPEVERLAAWTFSNLQVSGKAAYVSALAHRSPNVRARAAYVFQQMRQHGVAFVPALAALLTMILCQRPSCGSHGHGQSWTILDSAGTR
ncbi:MAG: hypothetical protein QOJ73_545 [Streptosporangiaceae bacterium]|nr:hypothetical protein [Streptosporangiaceae bacterium]